MDSNKVVALMTHNMCNMTGLLDSNQLFSFVLVLIATKGHGSSVRNYD
jgi:hypothetical protein